MTTTDDRRSMLAATLTGGSTILLGSPAGRATSSPVAATEVRNLRWCHDQWVEEEWLVRR